MSMPARFSPVAALARLRQSRRASLILFGCTLGALAIAAAWFTSARSDLAEAYARVGSRQQALAATQQLKQEAQLKVQMANGAAELVRRAQAGGYSEAGWGERLINVTRSPLDRDDVNALLAGVGRDPARIFGAEDFDIAVTHAEEGLFDLPGPRSPPLLMSLRGTLLFRTRQPGGLTLAQTPEVP